ncbi:MAG: hypothetical protein IPJ30_15915 [Acidobacteria bacterium]|nr:hypothetical protein [Acidobacteriota bacterium]
MIQFSNGFSDRLPDIPDSRFKIPDSRFQIPGSWNLESGICGFANRKYLKHLKTRHLAIDLNSRETVPGFAGVRASRASAHYNAGTSRKVRQDRKERDL